MLSLTEVFCSRTITDYIFWMHPLIQVPCNDIYLNLWRKGQRNVDLISVLLSNFLERTHIVGIQQYTHWPKPKTELVVTSSSVSQVKNVITLNMCCICSSVCFQLDQYCRFPSRKVTLVPPAAWISLTNLPLKCRVRVYADFCFTFELQIAFLHTSCLV